MRSPDTVVHLTRGGHGTAATFAITDELVRSTLSRAPRPDLELGPAAQGFLGLSDRFADLGADVNQWQQLTVVNLFADKDPK